jgi:hypothetical protein
VNRLIGYRTSRSFAERIGGTLRLTHDAGFFSICSTALYEIAKASCEIQAVDASSTFRAFKKSPTKDPWPDVFAPPGAVDHAQSFHIARSRVAHRLPHHSIYRFIDFRATNVLVRTFFAPSQRITAQVARLTADYSLDASKLIAVCYRGTDKATEVRQNTLTRYLKVTRTLALRYPSRRILLQTDDSNARELFAKEFGQRVTWFGELPTTTSATVMHKLVAVAEREEFAANLVAATILLSRAAHVVTYTGNLGYWIALYRGHTKGPIQLR